MRIPLHNELARVSTLTLSSKVDISQAKQEDEEA